MRDRDEGAEPKIHALALVAPRLLARRPPHRSELKTDANLL